MHRSASSILAIAFTAMGCGGTETASNTSLLCAEQDAATANDDSDAVVARSDDTSIDTTYAADAETIDDAAAEAEVPGDVGRDGADATDSDSAEADPDNAILCGGMLIAGPPGEICDAVVRLDYESRHVLGWRLVCGEGPPLDDTRAQLLAQASLGIDVPLDARMSGFDPGFYHAPSATGPGAFAIVHPESARVIVAGTMTPAGGALTETEWNAPWDSSWCFGEFELLAAFAVVPADEPSFSDELAKEIAHDAWHGPIGALWEEAGGCTKNAYHAEVMRWAPEPGGPYREWIVAIEVGTDCSWMDD